MRSAETLKVSEWVVNLIPILSFIVMVAAVVGLFFKGFLFSSSPAVIIFQLVAAALMVWARVTFGRRSFHASAEPTEGGLVTTGPYRFIRHPIYTAVCLFAFVGALAHISAAAVGLALLLFLGAMGRILCEEKLLVQRYPEYARYAAGTKRMLPYIF